MQPDLELVELTNTVFVNSTNISTNIVYLLSPSKHAARLVGGPTATKAGEEGEKSEEDKGDDDEREVCRV